LEHKFNASHLYKINVDSQQLFPLNLEFEENDYPHYDFQGPGIYFTYFKDELVYIGYFFPNGDNRDARMERMKKEISTISMRGREVVFSQNAFNAHQQCMNYPVFQGEISDNGFQTSLKRVEFADKNWRSFKTNNFLKDFAFYWFREEKQLNRTREELEKLTQELRKFYKPTCNG
jgi:hypothetical protein